MLNQKYNSESDVLANYTYTDIVDGSGNVLFYALRGDSANDILSTQPFYSIGIDQAFAGSSAGAATKKIDLDFNLTAFNTPRTMVGTGTIQSCYFVTRTGGDGGIQVYCIYRVKKDGVEVANVTTNSVSVGTDATAILVSTAPITIPETHFKAGEVLTLTLEVWFENVSGTNSGFGGIAHDPQNRDGTYINPTTDDPKTLTQLNFTCPFKIET